MNPFLTQTEKPMVAIPGKRGGYLIIAPSADITNYHDLPPEVLQAAQAWAAQLEALGSPRAYWIILSEVTRHLHIHVYPRWETDSLQGVPLFEARDDASQPGWTPVLEDALRQWAEKFEVDIIRR